MDEKAILRLQLRERLAHLSLDDRETESRLVGDELRRLIGEMNARCIAAYVPLGDEPDIRSVLEEWIAEGRALFVPATQATRLEFRRLRSALEIGKGREGDLSEYSGDVDTLDARALDVALVPGRAFTARGDRLGRGKGCYDQWIAAQRALNPKTQYVGVCFVCQMLPSLPTQIHDQRVDRVVTARGVSRPALSSNA